MFNLLNKEIDLDEILNKIKGHIETGLNPLNSELDEYYRNTIKKDNFSNLKESAQLINIFLRNSKQICNLSALLQKDKYLEGLNSINEVYDSQVNLMEEITLYHKEYRSKKTLRT